MANFEILTQRNFLH